MGVHRIYDIWVNSATFGFATEAWNDFPMVFLWEIVPKGPQLSGS